MWQNGIIRDLDPLSKSKPGSEGLQIRMKMSKLEVANKYIWNM